MLTNAVLALAISFSPFLFQISSAAPTRPQVLFDDESGIYQAGSIALDLGAGSKTQPVSMSSSGTAPTATTSVRAGIYQAGDIILDLGQGTQDLTISSSGAPTHSTATVTVTATTASSESTSVYTLPPEAFPTRSSSSLPAGTPSSVSPHASVASTATPVPLVMSYYPDWSSFPPENIDFNRFDWIDFAFAVPKEDLSISWDDKHAPDMLKRLVKAAHAAGKKVKLSIGGWSGSGQFSDAVAKPEDQQTLATNLLGVYNQYQVDGIDIDWEYPGQVGQSGNKATPKDSTNFLAFLQLLKTTLPAGAKITAAVQSEPFANADGDPLGDVSPFAEVLDWVLLMNYDVWGSSANPGPNAPLDDRCQNATEPDSSAVGGFNAWTRAGFPANKIVLGLPSYGYVSKSKATHLVQRRSLSRRSMKVTPHERPGEIKASQESQQIGSMSISTDGDDSDGGQVQFNSLIKQGALTRQTPSPSNNNTVIFTASGGFTRFWDNCSSTPFLRNEEIGQVITYDDTESLGLKTAFVRSSGMLGVNMFDVHGDTEQWDLIDSVRRNLGLV